MDIPVNKNLVPTVANPLQENESEAAAPAQHSFLQGTLAFLTSLCSHLVLFIVLALIPLLAPIGPTLVQINTEIEPEPETPDAVAVSELPAVKLGALSESDRAEAMALAAEVSPIVDIPSLLDTKPLLDAKFELRHQVFSPKSPHYHQRLQIRGASGQGVTGVAGAMDRLTEEILLSLEERPTLVVWIFDQSASLFRQRQWVHDRIERIYSELGVLQEAGHEAFQRNADQPLWTSVVTFGRQVEMRLDRSPNIEKIKTVIGEIDLDPSGVERVFTAIYESAVKYKHYRNKSEGGYQQRNVMIIAFTDEAGNDAQGLDETVNICRKFAMPVYVVGSPAPLGRRETMMKWVDPDPKFDQGSQWVVVEQGPESLMPERLRLHFASSDQKDKPIDSGFGPYHLTRLCVETGGIFFTAHPNRKLGRSISRGATDAFSGHIERFFDPKVMQRYQPDYVPAGVYLKRLQENQARRVLVKAAKQSWLTPMESPQMRFVKRNEGSFVNEINEAQKGPAKLEPKIEGLYRVLLDGEKDRANETVPRWQAGYDLAMGRVLALLVRTQSYNAMLAKAKRGLKFKNPKNNTWELKPSNEITVSTKLAGANKKALLYLQSVVDDHAGTPWAYLAKRELGTPLGWTWHESRTELPKPSNNAGGGNNNPQMPRNDQARKIKRKPPKRKPPRA